MSETMVRKMLGIEIFDVMIIFACLKYKPNNALNGKSSSFCLVLVFLNPGTTCYPLYTYSKKEWEKKVWTTLNPSFKGNEATRYGF